MLLRNGPFGRFYDDTKNAEMNPACSAAFHRCLATMLSPSGWADFEEPLVSYREPLVSYRHATKTIHTVNFGATTWFQLYPVETPAIKFHSIVTRIQKPCN